MKIIKLKNTKKLNKKKITKKAWNTYGTQFYLADEHGNSHRSYDNVFVALVVVSILHTMDVEDPMSNDLISCYGLHFFFIHKGVRTFNINMIRNGITYVFRWIKIKMNF